MKKVLTTGFGFILVILSFAQDFEIAVEKGIDLKKYQTFTIVKGAVISGSDQPIDANSLYYEIKPIIVRELKRKGYTYQDSAAELTVTYVIESIMRTDVQRLGPLGQAPASNPAMVDQSQTWSREFRQGTLILNLVDASRKTTVWSAEGTMDISRTRGGNLLDYAVKSAFRKFPDKTKDERKATKKKG
ncbi:MAG: DUF4136 domain-containing protein [Cyclobacteriaceae bacterium]|nr:DUF4136 domain-containing protein [Cyclobacteriaceae bacterium]